MLLKNCLSKFYFFIFFFILSIFAEQRDVFVRIGVLKGKKTATIYVPNEELWIKKSSGEIEKIKNKEIKISYLHPNKVKFNNKIYILPITIYSVDKIKINQKLYPAEIQIFSFDKKTLTFVNNVYIETYLEGVLPYEIEHTWPDEMLKVQAVIARTYALSCLGRHSNEGYDFCDTVHCQVYQGISQNKELALRIKKAVNSTKGLVVVSKKEQKILPTYYHAVCGGGTENISDVWDEVVFSSHLRHVKCNFCRISPYYEWSYCISQQKFTILLNRNNILSVKKITNIKPLSKTSTGRVKTIKIEGQHNKSIELKSEILRKIVGYNNIKSTKIDSINVDNEKICFYGHGWGHGVGLCQWGAVGLVLKGKKFDDVIRYYYHDVKIKKIY